MPMSSRCIIARKAAAERPEISGDGMSSFVQRRFQERLVGSSTIIGSGLN